MPGPVGPQLGSFVPVSAAVAVAFHGELGVLSVALPSCSVSSIEEGAGDGLTPQAALQFFVSQHPALAILAALARALPPLLIQFVSAARARPAFPVMLGNAERVPPLCLPRISKWKFVNMHTS
ncbi:unnamed protein product [Prorocentrum cordatum]|uniref:Secreted protein n=1 Tax=Prorocentrum cordatum TaxID=2364126 RepID=A0ABN9XBM2_9DINO|nr:unnamed protein product [Polarella glacialis]